MCAAACSRSARAVATRRRCWPRWRARSTRSNCSRRSPSARAPCSPGSATRTRTRRLPTARPGGRRWRRSTPSSWPPALLRQLVDGGRLVIPLGDPHRDQVLTVIQRVGDEFRERRDTRCRFVPLVSDEPAGESRRGGARRGGETAPGAPQVAPPVRTASEEEVAVMKAVAVRVSGTVHGVYYRASACRAGERLGLRGWARNVSDCLLYT